MNILAIDTCTEVASVSLYFSGVRTSRVLTNVDKSSGHILKLCDEVFQEAELKLNAAEQNLARVEDVLEQLKNQINTLARQAKQAIRYREISEQLRVSEGILLYGRWKEANESSAHASKELTNCVKLAADTQLKVIQATKERTISENKIPPLREEEAISAALLQRLRIQNDSLKNESERAKQNIQTLETKTIQLGHDISREDSLNQDAEDALRAFFSASNSLSSNPLNSVFNLACSSSNFLNVSSAS